MKTTPDLPDPLVRQARQRALQQGCSLKDQVAEFIRLGLHGGSSAGTPASSEVVVLDRTGLPLFRPQASDGPPGTDLDTALPCSAGPRSRVVSGWFHAGGFQRLPLGADHRSGSPAVLEAGLDRLLLQADAGRSG